MKMEMRIMVKDGIIHRRPSPDHYDWGFLLPTRLWEPGDFIMQWPGWTFIGCCIMKRPGGRGSGMRVYA